MSFYHLSSLLLQLMELNFQFSHSINPVTIIIHFYTRLLHQQIHQIIYLIHINFVSAIFENEQIQS